MFRPVATYRYLRERGRQPDSRWLLVRRPLLSGLVIAAFISFTTTGRLTSRLLIDGLIFWGFVPVLNLAVAWFLVARFGRQESSERAVDLFFSSFGPWLCFLLAVAGVAAFGPVPLGDPEGVPLSWIFAGFLAALTWASWIQLRFVGVVLGADRSQALLLLAGSKLAVWGPIVAFFALSDQLEPRLLQTLGM